MKSRISLLFAGALFCAAVSTTSQAQDTIRLGLQAVPTDVLYQAKDWGQAYDLKTEISTYSSAGDSLKAFLAGRVDVVSGGAARLVTMAAMQPEVFYIVAANQYGGDRYGVIVSPNAAYKSIEDLKGKKVGVVSGSGAHGTLMLYLERHKLSPKDFQFVNMKVEDIAAAVNRGVIDAGVAWEPHVALAEVNGLVKRIQSMKGVNESPNFILVKRDYADKNPTAVAKYIASMMDVAKLIAKDPKEAGEMIAAQMGKSGVNIPSKAMEMAVSRIVVDPKIEPHLLEELPAVAEPMITAGRIKSMPDFQKLVRTSYYDQAVKLAQAKQ